jgi:hypothetical protein
MGKHPWIAGAAFGAVATGILWLALAPSAERLWGQQAVPDPARAAKNVAVDARGSDPMLAGRIGEHCKIYFRRDRLGLAAHKWNEIISADVGSFNNTSVYVAGKLIRANTAWICVAGDKNKEYTIPTDVILMVEVHAK